MIVVDTNIIAYLMIQGEKSDLTREAFRRDPDWVSPLLWKSEFRNVIVQYLRKEWITPNQAYQLVLEAEYLMQGKEYEVQSFDVLSLASESGCSAYDCEYVALAKELDISLLTNDQKILDSFKEVALSLFDFIESHLM